MKKLVTMLLCLVLVIGTACMFGCGDATFNGNYKTVTEEEQATFVQEAAKAEKASISSIDFTKGADVSLSVKGKVKNDDVNVNVDASVSLKAIAVTVDEKTDYQAEVAVKAKADGVPTVEKVDADVKAYYADETAYLNGSVQIGKDAEGKIDLKNFISLKGMDIQSLIAMVSGMAGDAMDELPIDIDQISGILDTNLIQTVVGLSALVNMSEESGISVNLLFDLDANKVKAEIKVDKDDTKIDGALYIVLDENYNLTAVKIELKATVDGGDISVDFSFKGYNGKVNVPNENERKDYKDFNTDAELQLKISAIMGKLNPKQ